MGRFGGMAHDLAARNVQKGANHVRIRRTSSNDPQDPGLGGAMHRGPFPS